GNYTVNLTVTQVNPTNVTYRVINVTVDNEDPAGAFRTDRTGTKVHNATGNRYNATGVRDNNLTVDEDLFTTFTALDDRVPLSSDILNGTLKGKVAQWKWDFESDGTYDRTGQSTSWNYSKPGNFVLNLTVVDSVGHEGANVTMNVTVRDVTPPVIGFVILDPNNAWRETSTLSEGKIYFFNASRTTDNSLNTTEDNVNLSYRWKWGVGEGQNGTDLGMRDWRNRGNNTLNVSHVWTKWGDYKLEITVWDASDKNATVTRSPFPIQANTSAHPNLSIRSGSLKINPTTPEEGQQVTFTFNITNAKGSGNATQIRVMLAIRERNQDKNESSESFDVRFLNGSAVVTNPVLTPEWNLTVEITWHAPNKVANHSLRITVWDANEPTPWIDAGNRQDTSLLVKEAGWKFWAIVGAFLFVIFGLPILYYVVRKFRAGEWTLRRKRGEEGEEEEEEEEDEEEEDEEEEEVAGEKPRKKKRL
ncbi:MAG TPA: PKD domain-containing protein, partial [Thermoplasmata archaeon]|nr:PKD domain-containing protein [Thermoplasmata archaeon]